MDRELKNDNAMTRWVMRSDIPNFSMEPAGFLGTRPSVSVIIPTLNEAKNLPLVLPYLPMDWIDEVLLVDGRSSDNTVETAQRILPSIKVVLETKKGKGAAMYAGYKAASGDILVVMDADGSNDPREIPRYVKPLLEGADFVKGSRFAPGGGTTDMPRFRKWGNGAFVLMANTLYGTRFTDLCYGYHAFWRRCLDDLLIEDVNGFEIDTVLYLQALSKKMRIVEVPSFEGYRFYGEGKLQTIPDGMRVLKSIFHEWTASLKEKAPDLHMGFQGVIPNDAGLLAVDGEPLEAQQVKLDLQLMRLFSRLLFVGFNLDDALQNMLQLTTRALDARSGSIVVLDDTGNLKQACLAFEDKVSLECTNQLTEIVHQGLAGWVIRNHQPALIANTREDPRWLARDWDTGRVPRSALAIPLILGTQVLAVLTLVRPGPNRFTENDLGLLREVALNH